MRIDLSQNELIAMMKKKCHFIWVAAFLAGTLITSTSAGPGPNFSKLDDGIVVRIKNSLPGKTRTVRLQVVNSKIIHVTASPTDSFPPAPAFMTVPQQKTIINWQVNEADGMITLSTPHLNAIVDVSDGAISYQDKAGNPLASESKNGRDFTPYILEGDSSYKLLQRFNSPEDEGLFGLGQHQSGMMNYKNRHVDLTQNNTEVAVPFLLSSRNYGILWDNYSITKAGNTKEFEELNALKLYAAGGEHGWLTATYADKTDSTRVFLQRPESVINYEFLHTQKQFPANVELGKAMVTWEGSIESATSGVYHFMVKYAGYTQVWIDGELRMDRWRQAWNPGTAEFPVTMQAGKKHAVKIRWNPDGGESYIAVRWFGPPTDEEKKQYGFKSESGKVINYYFVHGANSDEVIAGYRQLTGAAPIMPKWAMGFWQSRERYKTQRELMDVAAEFRKRKIPLDNIVLDWSYWEENKWGSQDFDLARFPDARGMIDSLHKQYNTRFMISVWPKFYEGIKTYDDFDAKGWLFKRNIANRQRDWIAKGYVSTFYDAFNPDARKAFWSLINNKLYSKGVDAWWMDATEPDILSNSSVAERKLLMTPTAAGSSTTFFNGFPLQNAKGIYEGQRAANPDNRVFILTRSAYAGMQRYAAATWSGDIASRWHDFKDQIPAGVNFSMSGLPYWTMDIGGFAVERRFENPNPADREEWREMNTRWFQYGAFCPIFRSHGQYPFREIYNIAPEEHPAYKTMLYYNKLRYRLMPYIYTLAGRAYHDHYTMMRGLVMDFSSDTAVFNIPDQYMFGDALLVNPVTEYKATSRALYLPSGTNWYNFYTGKSLEGGQTINASAPLETMPLYVKAGSIIPVGPALLYTGEKSADVITLFIYGGKDATFTLYEDEDLNYNYERGAYSNIPIEYNHTSATVTIGDRKGTFNGMLKKRVFKIVLITPQNAVAFDADARGDKTINYTGKKVSIKIR